MPEHVSRGYVESYESRVGLNHRCVSQWCNEGRKEGKGGSPSRISPNIGGCEAFSSLVLRYFNRIAMMAAQVTQLVTDRKIAYPFNALERYSVWGGARSGGGLPSSVVHWMGEQPPVNSGSTDNKGSSSQGTYQREREGERWWSREGESERGDGNGWR